MYGLSWAIRSKPEWQRKARDPTIFSKWRREALQQQEPLDLGTRLTEKMVDYVLEELAGYVKITDDELGIERGCFDAIWYSDRLISDGIAQRLKTAVRVLEDVPENQKDWHPGSNGQVLDLVHPSLYCIVYGRSNGYLPEHPRIQSNLLPIVAPPLGKHQHPWSRSEAFCWMPSDFAVLADGSVKLLSPYINNLHPTKHEPLYRIIEEVLGGFIPMFERVLSEIDKENAQESSRLDEVGCIFGVVEGQMSHTAEGERLRHFPEANTYAGELEDLLLPVSLSGTTIQCITKLANIHLTPEQPKYAGGSWHVEGMANERIVASGIYYYDEQNITESRLSFRVHTDQPEYHDQDDHECMQTLYGIAVDEACVQELGSMVTKEGRALAWPNLLQHCVSPFELHETSKPGHRKILAIFLVDPTIRPIASATDVPPQQAEWAADAFQELRGDSGSLVSRLPQELVQLIKTELSTSGMKEAKADRLKLMKERTVFVKKQSTGVSFNMCEH
ncbi:hypothetical protein DFH09DRAFT_1329481 [Mycena vulgaris]|nr:hypothetical protein DFH09DRAFT_1329481 [Mycena vulgaris]